MAGAPTCWCSPRAPSPSPGQVCGGAGQGAGQAPRHVPRGPADAPDQVGGGGGGQGTVLSTRNQNFNAGNGMSQVPHTTQRSGEGRRRGGSPLIFPCVPLRSSHWPRASCGSKYEAGGGGGSSGGGAVQHGRAAGAAGRTAPGVQEFGVPRRDARAVPHLEVAVHHRRLACVQVQHAARRALRHGQATRPGQASAAIASRSAQHVCQAAPVVELCDDGWRSQADAQQAHHIGVAEAHHQPPLLGQAALEAFRGHRPSQALMCQQLLRASQTCTGCRHLQFAACAF